MFNIYQISLWQSNYCVEEFSCYTWIELDTLSACGSAALLCSIYQTLWPQSSHLTWSGDSKCLRFVGPDQVTASYTLTADFTLNCDYVKWDLMHCGLITPVRTRSGRSLGILTTGGHLEATSQLPGMSGARRPAPVQHTKSFLVRNYKFPYVQHR